MAHPGPELITLVSSYEATKSNYPPAPPWMDASPSHGYPPYLPPWHFIRLPWLISAIHLYSWEERGTERKVFCTRTKPIDQARLQMQTSWPWVQHWPGYKCRPLDPNWVQLTNHKATMSPQEGRIYAESFLVRNKFYKTNVKFSSLIFKKGLLVKTYKKCISLGQFPPSQLTHIFV